MSLVEVVFVDTKKVSCNGVKVVEGIKNIPGHPTIYLDMGGNDNVVCPYCNRHFTMKKPKHNLTISISAGTRTLTE